MVFHAIAALSIPVATRMAITGAQKFGWMPEGYYVEQILTCLRKRDYPALMHALHRLSARGGSGEKSLVVLDLTRMHVDGVLQQKEKRYARLRSKSQARRDAIVREEKKLPLHAPARTTLLAFFPSLLRIVLFSTAMGVVFGYFAGERILPVWVAIAAVASLLAIMIQREKRRIRLRKKSLGMRAARRRKKIATLAAEDELIQEELERIRAELASLTQVREVCEQIATGVAMKRQLGHGRFAGITAILHKTLPWTKRDRKIAY